jgi:hypothetical protein
MIRSAIVIASAMADSNAGDGRPSQFASLRAARMLAAISKTRLRPSSTAEIYHVRLLFAMKIGESRSEEFGPSSLRRILNFFLTVILIDN